MRTLTIALVVGLAVSLFATQAQAQAKTSAIIAGGVGCFESPDGPNLSLDLSMGGMVLGVVAGQFPRIDILSTGTCDQAIAALSLPSPLCTTGSSPFTPFSFICSGSAQDFVEAVGSLAQSMMSH